MEHHKLLTRQLKKYLLNSSCLENEYFKRFIQAVSDSYHNFDQDKELSQRAFDLADQEYFEITTKLTEEKKIREQSIETILQTISTLEGGSQNGILYDGGNLLAVTEYLGYHVKKRKEAEERLKVAIRLAEKASVAKSEFLSTMSHEIRSPLNVIIGMAHILKEEKHLEEQKENLEILEITSKSLLSLINDILDYSKIESGKLELEHTSFNLGLQIFNIVKGNSNFAAERGNELTATIDEKLPSFVVGDSVRIGQVITNLVSNAIKFTKNGQVGINLELLENIEGSVKIRVKVKDTGIGISEKGLKKIFNSFTQAKSNTTREYGGTGLGLTITKKLLFLMGSEIKVKSELGKGSTFYFDLKLKLGNAIEYRSFEKGKKKDLGGAKILVVDDLEYNLTIVRKIVKGWNVVLDYAKDGIQAVEKTKNNDYEIILMDLQMPLMDGEEATRKIRDFNQQIPIIALTASSNESTKAKVLEAGMNAYLTKPFNPSTLYQQLSHHLAITP